MLEEAAHELVAAETAGSPGAGLAVLVLDRDRLVVEADDAGIGQCDTEDVAGEVVKHGLFAVAPSGDVENPKLAPDLVRDDDIRAFLPQQRLELSPYQPGESLDGNQELPARRMPGCAVLGDPATTDQAMNMRVEDQLLRPGMQHGEHGDSAANVTRIAREFDDRRGAGLHQHGVAVALMGAQHLAQFGRNGDDDVEVWNRQHLRLTAFEPLSRLGGVALRTTAVAAGMIGEHLGAARLAAPDLTAERRGTAVDDVLNGAPVRWQHQRAVSREVIRREAAEHVSDLDHDRASEAGHQPIEQTMQRRSGRRGEMSVDGGGGDAGMAEQALHDADVDAVLDQPGGVGVAQGVRRNVAPDSCRSGGCREAARQYPRVERRISTVVGEQPAAVVMGEPEAAQFVENRLWQRRQPLFVALADDAQHQVGPVN